MVSCPSPTRVLALPARPLGVVPLTLTVLLLLGLTLTAHAEGEGGRASRQRVASSTIAPVPVLASSGVATPPAEVASLATPLPTTATPDAGVTLIDITQLKSDPFTLKKESFQEAGQQLGKEVEVLQGKLATGTNSWLGTEIGWGISWLKFLVALPLFLILLIVDLGLRRLIGRQETKYHLEGRGLNPLAWAADSGLDPALVAIRPPLSLFIWGYGGLTIIAFLLSRVQTTDEHSWITATAGQLAELGGLVAFFWCLFRLITVLDIRLRKWAESTSTHWDNLLVPFVGKTLRFFLPFVGLIFALPLFHLSPATMSLIQRFVSLTLIGALTWILFELVRVIEKGLLALYDTDIKKDLTARRVLTQVHILKKVLFTVIGVLSLAMMLMVFDSVRQLGTSILASAGVLGIIVGLAAQRTIGTLLAGVQIALTQPMRIGDVVIVEGEWGWIEEVSLTFVVVKIWDLRRLVLPISYFIEKPFQNWTRTSAKILGTIFFHVDYTFPVEELRKPLQDIVAASPLWDKDVCGLQVTDTTEQGVELRALVSAEDSSKAWDLRCEVREKVLAWLQEHHPQALPKVRIVLAPRAVGEDRGHRPS